MPARSEGRQAPHRSGPCPPTYLRDPWRLAIASRDSSGLSKPTHRSFIPEARVAASVLRHQWGSVVPVQPIKATRPALGTTSRRSFNRLPSTALSALADSRVKFRPRPHWMSVHFTTGAAPVVPSWRKPLIARMSRASGMEPACIRTPSQTEGHPSEYPQFSRFACISCLCALRLGRNRRCRRCLHVDGTDDARRRDNGVVGRQ